MIPDNWDEIITAASSGYGLVALGILVAGTLAIPMTKGSSPTVRSGIFVFLVIAFMASLGFAATQIPEEKAPTRTAANSGTIDRTPIEADILSKLQELGVEFVDANTFILSKGNQTYLQALGGGDAFHMEYRAGSADKHFGCSADKNTLIAAFSAYAADTDTWQTVCDWSKMEL